MNELLMIGNLILIYGGVLLAFRFFGKTGLYCFTVLATMAANIEVLIVVDAFGMEQTLGNILFASTFVVTDILSENYGKKEADKAVAIGVATSVMFLAISQMWVLYTPAKTDIHFTAITQVFKSTPRLLLASIGVYAVVQAFDVFLYHLIWKYTTARSKDAKRFLWVRNNVATLISQALNAVLYTWAAFGGMYSTGTLINIALSSYVIFIFTSLLDTPVVYAARQIYGKFIAHDPSETR